MTDEERRVLCTKLRDGSLRNMPKWAYGACNEAADEIERLAEEAEEWKQAAEIEADEVTEIYDKIKGHAVTQSNELAKLSSRKLCADLRLIADDEIEGESWTGLKCKEAADEIERLAAENERLQNELRLWKEQG